MSYINFNPTAQQGFQNALSMGMQMGAQARQAREQKEYRNALAQFDPSDPETLKPIMAARPDVGIQLQGQVRAQQQAANASGIEGLEDFRPLLEEAMKSPESWSQAYQAGINAGYDMSRVPQQFDPRWAEGQLAILNAAKDGSIAPIMRDLQLTEGFRNASPEQREEMLIWALEGRYGSEYVDNEGNVRRQSFPMPGGQRDIPTIASPDEARTLPPGTEFRTPDGRIMRVPAGGSGGNVAGGFPRIGPGFLDGL